jgi:hypothetical protein
LIDGSTFSGNTTGSTGGGALRLFTTWAVTITNSTFSGNSATGSGGAMTVSSGDTVILNNATMTQNAASQGGGIRRNGGTVTIANSILCGNSASSSGPEISSGAGGIVSQGYNVICDTATGNWTNTTGDQTGSGGGAIDPNEAIVPTLADNGSSVVAGGETVQTHEICTGSGTPSGSCTAARALHNGNSATPLDGGLSGGLRRCESTDQRAATRPIGPRCDIGASEAIVEELFCQLPTPTSTATATRTPTATQTPVGFGSDTFCVGSSLDDGLVRSQSAFYPPTGDVQTFGTPLRAHRSFDGVAYVTRILLLSVDGSIDDLAIVTGARLVATMDMAPVDTDGRRFVCEWYDVGVIDADDYVTTPPTSNLALDVALSAIPSSGTWTATLDTALANLYFNRTGPSGLRCFVSEGNPPTVPSGRNEVDIKAFEQGAAPCIEIDFVVPSPTPTSTATSTATVTPTATPTSPPEPTFTPVFLPQAVPNSPTATSSPTATVTPTGGVPTVTLTRTVTRTVTVTRTITRTPTRTFTGTPNTPTRTGTWTRTPTIIAGTHLLPINPTAGPEVKEQQRVRFRDLVAGCLRSAPPANPTPGDLWFDEASGEPCYASTSGNFCGADPTLTPVFLPQHVPNSPTPTETPGP